MGDWNSLHLLDEERYRNETLRILKNKDLIKGYWEELIFPLWRQRSCLTPEIIANITLLNQELFADLENAGKSEHWDSKLNCPAPDWGDADHNYRYFVTKLMFRTSAEFLPYFKMGKRYLESTVSYKTKNTIAEEIISGIFNGYGPFNWDSNGMRKIVSTEDIAYLISDIDNIIPNDPSDPDEQDIIHQFKYFLQFAHQNKLALLAGQNIDTWLKDSRSLKLGLGLAQGLDCIIYKY